MARKEETAVLQPNLGLYLDRPPIYIPERGLRDCLNVRIQNKAIQRQNIGYGPFPDGAAEPLDLDGLPVMLIDNFFPRDGGQFLVLANTRDLFVYDEGNESVAYLTPRYETGTVDVTNGSAVVTGTSTAWSGELEAGNPISFGATGANDPAGTWYEIASVDSDTQITLTTNFTGTTATGEAYTARHTFTGDMQDYWETTLFFAGTDYTVGSDGDRWYGTNGVDRPVAWEAGEDQAYFPDFGNVVRCRAFATTKNIMMLINISLDTGENRPYSVRTSAIGAPEDMVNNEASEFVAHSGADELTTAYNIGEGLAVYGQRSITLTQFVGPPVMFVFRTVIDGLGPRSGRAVADFGDFHKFIGPDAQYVFDGIGVQEVNSHVWQDAIRQMSPQRLQMISSHFDEERGDLIWVVPLNSDSNTTDGPPEQAFVEHYLEEPGTEIDYDVHTKRELPATAWGFFERLTTLTFDQLAEAWEDQNYRWNDQFFQGAFPFNVFGTADGKIYTLGTRDSANGVPMTSFARFGRRAIGTLRNKGMVRRVYPMVETLPSSTHDLTIRLHTTDRPGGKTTLEYTEGYPMTQTTNHFLSPRIMARYVELEVRTEEAGHIFNLLGYDLDVVPGGER